MSNSRLSVQIARTPQDIKAVQALRFDVFFNEYQAQAYTDSHADGLDRDMFDDHCAHLMVVDNSQDGRVVATTRLLLSARKPADLPYIAASEFSIPLLDAGTGNYMEVGRSCVHKDYRDGNAIQLLWRGITKFVFACDIDYLFGCASFHETDPDRIAHQLSYLYHRHLGDAQTLARALEYRPMDLLPADQVDDKTALAGLPPLIKAYLQLGGVVGDGVALDDQFKTLDILMTVEIAKVPETYVKFFKKQADRLDMTP